MNVLHLVSTYQNGPAKMSVRFSNVNCARCNQNDNPEQPGYPDVWTALGRALWLFPAGTTVHSENITGNFLPQKFIWILL